MLLNSVMARLALFLLGIWSIEAGQQSLRKGNLTGAQGASSGGLRSGDIIVANLTSYVDVLYLCFRYSPVFTQSLRTVDGSANAAEVNRHRPPPDLWLTELC